MEHSFWPFFILGLFLLLSIVLADESQNEEAAPACPVWPEEHWRVKSYEYHLPNVQDPHDVWPLWHELMDAGSDIFFGVSEPTWEIRTQPADRTLLKIPLTPGKDIRVTRTRLQTSAADTCYTFEGYVEFYDHPDIHFTYLYAGQLYKNSKGETIFAGKLIDCGNEHDEVTTNICQTKIAQGGVVITGYMVCMLDGGTKESCLERPRKSEL